MDTQPSFKRVSTKKFLQELLIFFILGAGIGAVMYFTLPRPVDQGTFLTIAFMGFIVGLPIANSNHKYLTSVLEATSAALGTILVLNVLKYHEENLIITGFLFLGCLLSIALGKLLTRFSPRVRPKPQVKGAH